MKLERFLFRNIAFYFAGFLLLAVLAFWPNYFGRLFSRMEIHFHAHGISMTLWCVMLIAQATLIRYGKNKFHRAIGKVSYVLVPVIIISTLSLLHHQLKDAPIFGARQYYFMALVLNALLVFGVFYGLAIGYKHKPAVHARFMLCTIFPLFTPVTDRLIAFHLKPLIGMVPVVAGGPMLPVIGFVLADLMLIGLSLWDWRTHKRFDVFPVALLVLLAYHISVFTFFRVGFWQSFGNWFMSFGWS